MASTVRNFNVADMSDRCILCGVGDESIDHPEYTDWVNVCLINNLNGIQFNHIPQVKCDQCRSWSHTICAQVKLEDIRDKEFEYLECLSKATKSAYFTVD